MTEIGVPDYRADICTAFARGNIGRAGSLASSEDFDTIRDEAVWVMTHIRKMDTADLIGTLEKLKKYKLNITDFLDIIMIWYRDVLMYKATMDTDALIFRDEAESIKEEALESSYDGIETVLKVIEKTKKRLRSNVNYELAMELLLLTIKENR